MGLRCWHRVAAAAAAANRKVVGRWSQITLAIYSSMEPEGISAVAACRSGGREGGGALNGFRRNEFETIKL